MKLFKIWYWLPRILAIIYIGFLALFALDVFVPNQSFIYYFSGLIIHLIPNMILGFILYIAWRNEKVGGILFGVGFAACLWFFRGGNFLTQLTLFSPLLVIGSLFIFNALRNNLINQHK